MSSKPWEGRSVWCQGSEPDTPKGWVEIRETGADLELVMRRPAAGTDPAKAINLNLTREQAKTFAAQIMNLANRDRL